MLIQGDLQENKLHIPSPTAPEGACLAGGARLLNLSPSSVLAYLPMFGVPVVGTAQGWPHRGPTVGWGGMWRADTCQVTF